MAFLSVNAAGNGRGHEVAGQGTLEAALAALPEGRPVTVLIHGYRFSPHDPASDPHRHILSLAPRRDCWKAISWPRHLHLDRPGADLGIGFGWAATGGLPAVAARAHEAGADLAAMMRVIRSIRPDLPLQLMAHSLGARVALSALRSAPEGAVRRIILIAGAEYRDAAADALAAPGAARTDVLNVTSGENAPFDLVFRLAVRPARLSDRPLSAGLADVARWTDLPIDRPETRTALRALGHRIRAPQTRVCHWSGYLRPGLFAVYRRLLDPAETHFGSQLRHALAEARIPDERAGPEAAHHVARA
ncbi:lysophospholipase [Roseibacterium sp. SDUM158016]|uniref:lysophospholipase n=1 Tax=Roseicyclus sediminis TaxID=2980997 RepID=UPI0021CE15D5|nr:lysophospholipase [Roseibacterium sp. SDUM158016]MCU4653826.1 lysophospholipase [Roseibacterium sp. SDUM158016]